LPPTAPAAVRTAVVPNQLSRPITGTQQQQQQVMQQSRMAGMTQNIQRPGMQQPMMMQQQQSRTVMHQHNLKFAQTVRNMPQPASQYQQPIVQQTMLPQQSILIQGQEPLTTSMLAAALPQEQKQMLGERLFPLIQRLNIELAGKITGMLLEMDNSELLMMLENADLLKSKVDEAVDVLQVHQSKSDVMKKE